jgi:hypothetical protein
VDVSRGLFRKTQSEWDQCVAIWEQYQRGEITSSAHDRQQQELNREIRHRVATVGVVVPKKWVVNK